VRIWSTWSELLAKQGIGGENPEAKVGCEKQGQNSGSGRQRAGNWRHGPQISDRRRFSALIKVAPPSVYLG